jgi:ribonuclease HII
MARKAVPQGVRDLGSSTPSLRVERALLREGHGLIAGMDEVGRGALAGPVSVGVVVIDHTSRTAPAGIKDSKLLAPEVRRRLTPRIRRWAIDYAVGHASPDEIDVIGIIAALRLAGTRALAALHTTPDVVVLDGNHDWLSQPVIDLTLFDMDAGADRALESATTDKSDWMCPPVHTLIRADRRCASVAAASVLAKCERDGLMEQLAPDFPRYQWESNKGYGSPEHIEALRAHGPSHLHRRSWRLPVADVIADDAVFDEVALNGGYCDEGVRA